MNEAILAYENGYITLQTKITIRCEKEMEDGTCNAAERKLHTRKIPLQ